MTLKINQYCNTARSHHEEKSIKLYIKLFIKSFWKTFLQKQYNLMSLSPHDIKTVPNFLANCPSCVSLSKLKDIPIS